MSTSSAAPEKILTRSLRSPSDAKATIFSVIFS